MAKEAPSTLKSEELTILKHCLSSLGLSSREAVVCRSLILLGARPASIIAKHSGLNRAHTYEVLASLKSKGLVDEIERNYVKHFSCPPPEQLLSLLSEREKEISQHKQLLESILPRLLEARLSTPDSTALKQIKGSDALKELFEESLQGPGEHIYIFAQAELSSVLSDQTHNKWRRSFTSRRIKNNIWLEWACPKYEAGITGLNRSQKRRVTTVPGVASETEILVFNNTLAYIPRATGRQVTVIKNKEIAAATIALHQALTPQPQ